MKARTPKRPRRRKKSSDPLLAKLGITAAQARQWMAAAQLPRDTFEQYITSCRETGAESMSAEDAVRFAKARDGSIANWHIDDIHPSPENDRLYRPVNPDDPEIIAMANSISAHGLLEPLIVTLDGWILSGHRRYAAARLAGLKELPVRVWPIRRLDDIDAFVRVLRECNRQREKTLAEKLKEEVVAADPAEAYQSLLNYRREKSDMSGICLGTLELSDPRKRNAISKAKEPFLQSVADIIAQRRKFWPLSDRQVHYALLNDPPLRHAKKPLSVYANDRASYQDLCDLLTRARLTGRIPWESIGDETRPVVIWQTDPDPQPFLRRELDDLLKGYWRDYQQSQINHIEIVGEKLTVQGIVKPVAQEFAVPLTIGRGYCSINPRRELAERFRKSGREKLVVLFLSDFDPDGQTIAESFARSLRDDFGIDEVHAIKVALTLEQVREMELPPQMKAKAGSATRDKFVERFGDDVYELEAIPPTELQNILRRSIESVIDIDAFNAEVEREQQDAAYLDTVRRQVMHVFETTSED